MRFQILMFVCTTAACGGSSPAIKPGPTGASAPATEVAAPAPKPDPETTPTPAPTPPGPEGEPAAPPAAPAKVLVLVDGKGIGLGGNDPVAYRTKNAATAGKADQTSSFDGATYQFATTEAKRQFESDKAKHAPQFGGYCAYAASQNRLSNADPKVFAIHDGQLLVFTNKDYLARFKKDPAGTKAKADANWPGLVEKHGKAP